MPIYEYECNACGERHEFIQKFSEGPKRKCPACGKLRLKKLVSAAAFHLKGSGWYVTDFRDNNSSDSKSDAKADGAEAKSDATSDAKGDSKSDASSEAKGESKGDSKTEKKADKKKSTSKKTKAA